MALYTIDNQDLSKVTYTGKWIQGGTPAEFNQTVMGSTHIGDFFTVSFRGESIAVFGTFDINSGGVETTYSIDGSSPVTAVSQSGSGDTSKQQFWKSNLITMGDHRLLVNMTKLNLDPTQPGEGTVWFDYFVITDPTRVTSSSDILDPSQAATMQASGGHVHAGLIIGAVIGILFFLLGVAFLVLFFRRRTRADTVEEAMLRSSFSPDRRAPMIQPFRLTHTMADTQTDGGTSMPLSNINSELNPWMMVSGSPFMASRKSLVTSPTRTGINHSTYPSIANSSTIFLSSSDGPLPSSSGSSHAEINSTHRSDASTDHDKRRRHLQTDVDALPQASPQHVDSGIRTTTVATDSEPPMVRELPPVYSPS